MNAVALTTFVREAITPLAKILAIVSLGGDLVFAAIRALQLNTSLIDVDNGMLRMDVDGSYPEFFQYAKFLVMALLMVRLTLGTGLGWYLIWAASFLFLMFDDALMFHERIGEWLTPSLEPFLPDATDTGAVVEFGFFAVVGLAIAGLAAVGIRRAGGNFRRFSIDMIVLLAIGAMFAVSVDFIHGLLTLGYVANSLFAVAEDGGEMFAVSLMLTYSAMVSDRQGQLKHWLTDVRRLTD